MKKSEQAQMLYDVINLYSDFVISGKQEEHASYNFESLDIPLPLPSFSEPDQKANKTAININDKTKSSINKNSSSNTSLMIELAKEIIHCKNCPLHTKAKEIIPGRGLVNTNIFVIANPISHLEEKEKYPLIKTDRDFFNKWLSAIDVNPEKIFITNILKCNWTSMPLTIQYIEACRKHLDRQIEIVKPTVIITLGQIALSSIKKAQGDIIQEHGNIISYNGYPVFPLYDPAMVLKNPDLKSLVWADLKKLKTFLENS